MTVSETAGVGGTLQSIETHLTPRGHAPIVIGGFDSNCYNAYEFNPSVPRRVPPQGSLQWCVPRIATPDVTLEYMIRFAALLSDDSGTSHRVEQELPVTFIRR